MQEWLVEYEEQYGNRIRKNRSSISRVMAMTKLPEDQAKALQKFCHDKFWLNPLMGVNNTKSEMPKVVKALSTEELLLEDDYTYNPVTHTYLTFLPGLPKPLVTSEETHKAVIRAYSNFAGNPSSINEISRTFGWPREWVIKYLRIHGMTHDREPFSKEELLSRPDDDLIQDALQQRRATVHKKIEKAKWADIQKDAIKWVHFEDTVLKVFQTKLDEADLDLEVPELDFKGDKAPFALIVTPADLHYGKIGIDGYNRDTAKERLFQTTQDLLAWVTLYGTPEEIILSGLGDWFHVDNDDNTTTAGTKQDVDIPFPKLLVEGCELMASYIQILRQVAPVKVITIPGNHDSTSATVLNLFLTALYQKDTRVTISNEAKSRQYYVYGQTLMGFAHGKDEKLAALTQLMPGENPKAWGSTKHRIWFTGHTHHETVVDLLGIQVLSVPSLTGTDRWHNQNGYVGSRRVLAGFIIDKEQGLVNSISVPVK